MEYVNNPDFASEVENLMVQYNVPGLSLAIVQDDRTFSAGYGKASLESSVPCTPDTLFDIASCAKSMTAASVALLVEDNEKFPEIKYDAKMSHLLPEDFVMSEPEYTEGVTVEDVLSHRTGMAPHDDSYFGTQAKNPDNARSITRNLRNLAIAAPLRSKYLYCNMMYTVATHLIETKTQQSFFRFLGERLFEPLGMSSSCLHPGAARAKGLGDRIATGYTWSKKTAYRGLQSPDCPEGQGAGSVISSANDMIKWVKALVNQEGPITPRVYQGLVKLRSFPHQHPARIKPYTSPVIYAAGLDVYYYRGCTIIGHNGVIPGFASRFVFSPELNFGAVLMGNSGGAGSIATVLVRKWIDGVLGVSEMESPMVLRLKKDTSHCQQNKAKVKEKKKKKKCPAPDLRRDENGDQKDKLADGQEKPLKHYAGKYWNAGYREMEVQIKGDHLFIDATDRSMGFTVRFCHVGDQTKYTAYLADEVEGDEDPVEAEFVFEEGEGARMGLRLEDSIPGLIWFERM